MSTEDVADLGWALQSANDRFAQHGRALFRVRSLGLKVPSVIATLGTAGAAYVRQVGGTSMTLLALVLLSIVLATLMATGPGVVAASIAAARNEEPSAKLIVRHLHRAPAFAGLWFMATVARGLAQWGLLSWYVDIRLSLAQFLCVDENLGPIASMKRSAELTRQTGVAHIKLHVQDAVDAMNNYGMLRAHIDGVTRRAIADAIIYDYLAGRLRPTAVSVSAPNENATTQHVTRRAAVAETNPCPRCGIALVPWPSPSLSLLGCSRCGGVWLDVSSAKALFARAIAAEALEQVLRTVRVEEVASVDRSASVRCPQCKETMSRSFDAAARAELDFCATHGAWFDGGELMRTAVAIEKTARDREEVRTLLASSPGGPSAYLLGARNLGQAVMDGVAELGRATLDNAVMGREAERDAAIGAAASEALEILVGGNEESGRESSGGGNDDSA